MGFTEIMCTYVYGTYQIIVGAFEAYQEMAKAMVTRIESLAMALITLWNYSIEALVQTCINFIKILEKKLVDMIYNPTGSKIWCSHLWDCLTFVSALLDPESLLFKQLNNWFGKQCQDFINADLLNNIRALLTDFQTFAKTLCSYGFTFEFGISAVKEILMGFKETLSADEEACRDYLHQIKNLCMSYLNWTIDTGVVDYLEKLEGLVNCVLDESETCASIATASNYYKNATSTLHIEKNGDTWGMNSEFKNSVYGNMEANTIRIKNAKQDIDDICDSIANPEETKRANNAFNLSKNLFPGGISWSDVTKEDGSFSWGKLWSKETWRKNAAYQYYNQSVDGILDAYRHGTDDRTQTVEGGTTSASDLSEEEQTALKEQFVDIDINKIMSEIEIDQNGNIYRRTGCDLIQIYPDRLPEPIVEEYYSTEPGSNEVLLDGDQIISVTQAAIKIKNEPESDLAKRCEKIWRTLNGWTLTEDTAKKYNSVRV